MPNDSTHRCPECFKDLDTKMHAKATGRHGKCQLEHLRTLLRQCQNPQSKAVLEDLAKCVMHHNAEYDRQCLLDLEASKISNITTKEPL